MINPEDLQDPTEKHFGDVGILDKYENNNNNNKDSYSFVFFSPSSVETNQEQAG
jgi:hypothetical protein